MKSKWIEFIEWAIPNAEEREAFRVYVKNAVTGVKNEKALILLGSGMNGKSVLARILCSVISDTKTYDPCFCEDSDNFEDISKNKLIFIDGYDGHSYCGLLQNMINGSPVMCRMDDGVYNTTWPDVIVVANSIKSEGLLRRCSVTNMPNVPEAPNPNLVAELMECADEIRDYFLN